MQRQSPLAPVRGAGVFAAPPEVSATTFGVKKEEKGSSYCMPTFEGEEIRNLWS